MANIKKVGNTAKKLEGVEIDGIMWFPTQVKKYKTEEEFIEAHKEMGIYKSKKSKPNASEKAEALKKAAVKLKNIYKQLK